MLQTFDWDVSQEWRKIHYKLRGGWGSCVVAWVMVKHQQLGPLLRSELAADPAARERSEFRHVAQPIGAADLDSAAKELEALLEQGAPEPPAGFTLATVRDIQEAARGGVQYQVVHRPFVAIRDAP